MFRTIRLLAASAVFSAALFALTATALAVPSADHGQTPEPSTTVQTAADNGSSTSPLVWIGIGVAVVALLAFAAVSLTRRTPRPRVARS